jgi:hypothetical protein
LARSTSRNDLILLRKSNELALRREAVRWEKAFRESGIQLE